MDWFKVDLSLTNAVKIIKDHDWTLPTSLAGDSKKQRQKYWQTTPSLSPCKKCSKKCNKENHVQMSTLVDRMTTHHLTMTRHQTTTRHPTTSVPVAFSYSP
jgi:hypothetical protein